ISQAREGYESDQWKLKVLERKSGRVTVVDLDDDVGAIAWRRDGKGLVVSVVQKARTWLEAIALDGKHHRLAEGSGDFDLAPDGSAIAVVSGMNRPPEVFRLGAKAPQ